MFLCRCNICNNPHIRIIKTSELWWIFSIQGVEILHTQTFWGDRRDQTKLYCEATYVRRASLQSHGQSKWVCLGLEIKQNHWRILGKKSYVLYQFRADVQAHGHPPWYTANDNAAEIDMCPQKCQVAATSTIRAIRSSSKLTGDM
jgi:hypothetical protein